LYAFLAIQNGDLRSGRIEKGAVSTKMNDEKQ